MSVTELIHPRAAMRLLVIHKTSRPLISPSLPERDVSLATLDSKPGASGPDTAAQKPLQTPDHIKNNHTLFQPSSSSTPNPLLSPSTPSSVDDFLLSKALKPSAVCAPTRLVAPLSTPLEWAAEIVYILRPLLYGMPKVVCTQTLQ